MFEIIQFLFPPFVACALMVGIFGYLGIHVLKREIIVSKLGEQKQERKNRVTKIEIENETINEQLNESKINLKQARFAMRRLWEDRISLEHELAKLELTATTANQALKETASWTNNHHIEMEKVLVNIQSLEDVIQEKTNPIDLKSQLKEIRASYNILEEAWVQRFNLRNSSLKKSFESSNEQLKMLPLKFQTSKTK